MRGLPDRGFSWLVGVLTALFMLLPLAPALLGRGTLIDVGALSAYLPFRAEVGRDYASAVVCRMDTIDYYLPGMAEIKRALIAGHLPTWAPYEVGGAPLASLPNHGALSPMSLPYLILPLWLAPAYVKLLEFIVAIGGMVLFLRRLGLSRAAGLVAGVVFAGSGFMVMWTNWPHTRVAALIPALFWALERLIQECRPRDVVLVGVVVASMLLVGFPAIVLFAHTVAAPYVLVRALTRYGSQPARAVQALLGSAGGVALGVGLSAVQIIPFAANLGALNLAGRDKTGGHLPLYTAFTVVDPYAVGTCVGGERFGPINPVEAIGAIGAAAVLVAAAALVLRRRAVGDIVPTRFIGGAVIVLAAAIWVGGPALAVLQTLPLWSSNGVGRAQSVFGFLVAVLVGVGFDRLLRGTAGEGSQEGRGLPYRHAAFVGLVAIGLVVVWVSVALAIRDIAVQEDFTAHLRVTLVGPVLATVAGAMALVVVARGPAPARIPALGGLAILVIAQTTAFTSTLLPVSRLVDYYPVTPTHNFLSQHLGAQRFGSEGNLMLPPTADYFQLRSPVGHEFTDQRWKDVLAAADPQAQRTPTYSSFSPTLPFEQIRRSPALDQLAVRYWVADPRRAAGQLEPLPDGRQAVSVRPGNNAFCTVPGGPTRGIRLVVQEPMPATPDRTRPKLHVAVTSGGQERRGSVLIDSPISAGPLFVAVAGEDLSGGAPASVRIWLTGTDTARVFRGGGDRLDCAAVRPIDDRVRLVHSDAGGAIYRRLDARPRIRWASTSHVVSDADERVALLKRGVPGDTVLLEDSNLPPGEGLPGTVDVVTDGRESIEVRVDAEGAGYLVVADSIARPGWRATVDGSPVAIEHGNHAFAAIPVPAGEHVIGLTYVAPGLTAGLVVSSLSLAGCVGLVVGPTLVRRRRRVRTRSEVAR